MIKIAVFFAELNLVLSFSLDSLYRNLVFMIMWRDKSIFQIVMHATGDNSPEFSDLKTLKR